MRITNHAYMRAHERFGWGELRTKEFVEEAFRSGKRKLRGKEKKHVAKRMRRIGNARKYIVHNRIILFLRDDVVLTMYRLPERFFVHWRK